MSIFSKENISRFGYIIVISLLLLLSYMLNSKVEELSKELKYRDFKIQKLREKIDSISIDNNEYRDYRLRKMANNISGIEIPERFTPIYINRVFKECERYNLPPRLVFRLIRAESNFRKNAISSAGAQGFFQIMPGTYKGYSKKLKIKNHSEMSNISVGIFYLKTLHKHFARKKFLTKEEQWRLTILSYNYGIGKVTNNKERFLGNEFKNYKYVNYILS